MGLSTLKRFIKEGYIVYGLDVIPLKEEIEGLKFFQVDLTKKEEIETVFNKIKEDNVKFDAIINTAGIYNLDSLIEISEENFIKIFDINVFSIYRIVKTFISLLNPKGKVIIISSELGPLDPLPFTGLYAISKSTIEKYVYSLRMELQLLDYQVALVRPGAVNTSLLSVSTTAIDRFIKTTSHYKCNASNFKKVVNSVENKNIHPDKIGNLIYKINQKKKPKYVYNINRNKLLLLLNFLPKRFQNYIIKKILNK